MPVVLRAVALLAVSIRPAVAWTFLARPGRAVCAPTHIVTRHKSDNKPWVSQYLLRCRRAWVHLVDGRIASCRLAVTHAAGKMTQPLFGEPAALPAECMLLGLRTQNTA